MVWNFYALTMYTLDVWIVTNHRIIDNCSSSFLTEEEFPNYTWLEYKIYPFRLRALSKPVLHFGDLQVQTAGAERKIQIFPNPQSG